MGGFILGIRRRYIKAAKPIKLMRDKTTTGLIYRGSGYGVKTHNITAVEHVLKLVPTAKRRISSRNAEKKIHNPPLIKNIPKPVKTPRL